MESAILLKICKHDPLYKGNVVRMYESFPFRKHIIIVFELLGMNLYRFVMQDSFKGLKKDKLRNVTQ